MEAAVRTRAQMEEQLRLAVQRQEFVLHFQAQVTDDGSVTGAEVLVRWLHPERGLVPPGEFITLAEETDLILPLGRWVLDAACAQLAEWAATPDLARLTLAVNVSSRQFGQADFVGDVLDALDRSGARPAQLKLELTESLLVRDVDDVIEKMGALKARGVAFSLDDFGTGYSSLSYLKRLPLDQLKIDRSFVRDVQDDANNAAIAQTIVALAQSLGLSVIAEGVETTAQRDALQRMGCKAYQGFLFSRPVALAPFLAWMRQG
jgi:EAL domain-containing protein (putative c-di-GMP-specific phosphodiesterase class I)